MIFFSIAAFDLDAPPCQIVIVSNQGPLKYGTSERLDLIGRDVPAATALEKQQFWLVPVCFLVIACFALCSLDDFLSFV